MKVLIGLGNPGEQYAKNRHNVGFMFADLVRRSFSEGGSIPEFKYDKYANAELIKLQNIILVKPQTFMNRSGETVRKIMIDDKTLTADDVFVAHDDLDISLGKFKIEKGHGPKLHNGLESIEQAIGTKDFWRVRIGVDNRTPENRIPGEAYVLQNFTNDEKTIIENIFKDIFERLIKDYLHQV